jgi:hypothetical protein
MNILQFIRCAIRAPLVTFLCLIGVQEWHFLLSEVGYVPLRGWPSGTTCLHCGKPHPRPLPNLRDENAR